MVAASRSEEIFERRDFLETPSRSGLSVGARVSR